jgi:hypothetical protein
MTPRYLHSDYKEYAFARSDMHAQKITFELPRLTVGSLRAAVQ